MSGKVRDCGIVGAVDRLLGISVSVTPIVATCEEADNLVAFHAGTKLASDATRRLISKEALKGPAEALHDLREDDVPGPNASQHDVKRLGLSRHDELGRVGHGVDGPRFFPGLRPELGILRHHLT